MRSYLIDQLALFTTPLGVVLSFSVAFSFAILELVTSSYSNTFRFVIKSPSLYVYGSVYGLLSSLVFLSLDSLIELDRLKIEGLGLSNIWVQAFVVGISAKGLLKISLFNISVGSTTFPIGPDTIVQFFEPRLIKSIRSNEFNSVKRFIDPYVSQYEHRGIDFISNKIKRNIPLIDEQEKKAFLVDLGKKEYFSEVLEFYLRSFGEETFKRVFPLDG